jgi:hypothetical protein
MAKSGHGFNVWQYQEADPAANDQDDGWQENGRVGTKLVANQFDQENG